MNSLIYDKPFKTYEEMILLLKERHIIINDKEFAINALKNFSYYSLINGYKNTFLQLQNSDSFIEGTKFEDLYTLHLIDTSLNNIILKYILYLEKALKSRISYLVSEKYGVFTDRNDFSCKNTNDYLYKNYYSNSNNSRINILKSLKQSITKNKHNPSIDHYLNNKNHIPPWILITNVTYGLTIKWYSILKDADKQSICNSFITSNTLNIQEIKEFIKKVFELTREYRNKIAHGNRTFSITQLPQLPKKQICFLTFNTISENEYNSKMGQNDTLAILLSLIVMIDDQYLRSNFIRELHLVLSPYINIAFNNKSIFEVFGFPDDLFKRLNTLANTITLQKKEE